LRDVRLHFEQMRERAVALRDLQRLRQPGLPQELLGVRERYGVIGSFTQAGAGVVAAFRVPASSRSTASGRVSCAYAAISRGVAPKPARFKRWRASSGPIAA
jgi:hypothetical protein